MAPVKPMGINVPKGLKEGVTGFPQEYNQTPTPSQDLNPDAVTDPDSLPEPHATDAEAPKKGRKAKRSRK